MKFISRKQAGLRPPIHTTGLDVGLVSAHWGGDGPGALDHDECFATWKSWQRLHMDTNGWADIAYNAGVCQHGYVFEGRGRQTRSAANGSNIGNSSSYAIVYIGGTPAPFTDEAKQGFVDAAEWLDADLARGHRDWVGTACPGDEIYEWVHSGHVVAGQVEPKPDKKEEALKDDEREAVLFARAFLQEIKNVITEGGDGNYVNGLKRLISAIKRQS